MDIDIGANLKLNTDLIPNDLLPLVPFVEQWSFDSLADQDQFALAMIKERPDDVEQFNDIVDKYNDRVHEWSSTLSFLNKHLDEMTEEDWKHPYWAFLNILKIREVTEPYDETDPEIQELRTKLAIEVRLEKFHEAVIIADAAFRNQNFRKYVDTLKQFQDLFTPVQYRKFSVAVKKVNIDK